MISLYECNRKLSFHIAPDILQGNFCWQFCQREENFELVMLQGFQSSAKNVTKVSQKFQSLIQ